MRSAVLAVLLGASAFASGPALAQPAAPADLCRDLLAYAEAKAAEPPKPSPGQQAPAPAAAPLPRADAPASGTQGGGSIGPSSSRELGNQGTAPTTSPVAPGAAPEAAASPHATDASDRGRGASPEGAPVPAAAFRLAGGVTVQQVRDTAGRSERPACREMAQTMRRAGADMPADLIALAAYDPDVAKRP